MKTLMQPVEKVRDVIQVKVFGVCALLGRKLNMPSKKIRLFFVYATFITVGSPIIIYLSMAFVFNLRYMVKGKRNPVWDI